MTRRCLCARITMVGQSPATAAVAIDQPDPGQMTVLDQVEDFGGPTFVVVGSTACKSAVAEGGRSGLSA